MKVISLHQEQEELIALAVRNDRQSQQKIFSRYSPKMLSVCRQYVKDIHTAEDVMITGFTKVFSSLKSFAHNGSFEGWIRRIMINECISHIRTRKMVCFIDDEFIAEKSFNNIECDLNVGDIQAVIDELPEGYRMVFNLYAIEGYKHREIAEMLGISEGTSKSQLSHARRILQDQINLKMRMYENGTE